MTNFCDSCPIEPLKILDFSIKAFPVRLMLMIYFVGIIYVSCDISQENALKWRPK